REEGKRSQGEAGQCSWAEQSGEWWRTDHGRHRRRRWRDRWRRRRRAGTSPCAQPTATGVQEPAVGQEETKALVSRVQSLLALARSRWRLAAFSVARVPPVRGLLAALPVIQ